ncbi:hypothetical protein PoB_004288200 [Plakobranchus ocellatus]|uniref:Uncharacterized protein n=1 Tax=Plakobranchus ocellatus TaxID=259542 RepID=A0AAV4BB44_9GAST|nr:hypothetical protein PoB_004288200 [Plakobranchus ocellatus]
MMVMIQHHHHHHHWKDSGDGDNEGAAAAAVAIDDDDDDDDDDVSSLNNIVPILSGQIDRPPLPSSRSDHYHRYVTTVLSPLTISTVEGTIMVYRGWTFMCVIVLPLAALWSYTFIC